MQFKKCTSFFLASLLLVSNIGLAFNVHYCGGKIADISTVFNVEEVCDMPIESDDACCVKKAADHKKCCEDKTVDLQDDADEIVVKSFAFAVTLPFIATNYPAYQLLAASPVAHQSPSSYYCDRHAPPLFKLHHQLLLYA